MYDHYTNMTPAMLKLRPVILEKKKARVHLSLLALDCLIRPLDCV